MKTFSSYIKGKQHLMSDGGVWLILLDIVIGTTTFRLAQNNEAVVYNSNTYNPYVFELESVSVSAKGDLPTVSLNVSNVARYLEPYLHLYSGAIGSTVTLYVVYSDGVTVTTTGISEIFNISRTRSDANWVYFTLGVIDPLTKRFPRDKYVSTMCRHRFKGPLCRYVGGEPTCNKTLTQCQAYGNDTQYGGSPGVSEGVYV